MVLTFKSALSPMIAVGSNARQTQCASGYQYATSVLPSAQSSMVGDVTRPRESYIRGPPQETT